MKRGFAPQRLPGGLAATTLALVAALLPVGGCSLLFVDGPPANYQKQPYFTCTSGVGWPIVDTVFAAWMAGIFIEAATRSAADQMVADYSGRTDMLYSGIFGGVAAASAAVGFVRSRDCRTALDELASRPQPPPSAAPPGFGYPQPYAPPPGYPPPAYPAPYDPWAPPAPPPAAPAPAAPPPAQPAPAPAPPAAQPPPTTRLVPRLHLDVGPLVGRVGALPSPALLRGRVLRLFAAR